MTLLPVATTRWCAARSTFMHCRGMSSHAFPTHQEMAAYLKPVEERIAKYRLDLETNPLVLDKLAAEGKISTYTAEFFKKDILKREKEISNCWNKYFRDIFTKLSREWRENGETILVYWCPFNLDCRCECLLFGARRK